MTMIASTTSNKLMENDNDDDEDDINQSTLQVTTTSAISRERSIKSNFINSKRHRNLSKSFESDKQAYPMRNMRNTLLPVANQNNQSEKLLKFPQAILTATVLASHHVLPLIDVETTVSLNSNTEASNYNDIENIENSTNNNNNDKFPVTTMLNTISNVFSASYDNSNNTTSYSNNINNNDGNDMLHTFEEVSQLITFYYVPILVITGTIGNVLSVVVFTTTKLRKVSSSYYLSALAISDTCFLFGLFTQWLNFVDIDLYNREFFCQFFTYFSNLASFCSVWFVVAFTVERFIAVIYPLRRQTMCTVKRAKLVLLTLTAIGCLHCIPFWISSTPVYSEHVGNVICDIKADYKEYITVLNYWDTVVVYVVPFAAIVVLNTFTGCSVWKFANVRRTLTMQKRKPTESPRYRMSSLSLKSSSFRRRQRHTQQASTSHSNEDDYIEQSTSYAAKLGCGNMQKAVSEKRKSANSSQAKVTKMLLIVSTVFVLFNLPSVVLRIKTYIETQTSSNEQTTVVLQYIFQLLFMTNFGINFLLYCLSGQNFRKAVMTMFRRVSPKKREGNTQVTVSECWRNGGFTGGSTRRRLMTQRSWNEMHELHSLK